MAPAMVWEIDRPCGEALVVIMALLLVSIVAGRRDKEDMLIFYGERRNCPLSRMEHSNEKEVCQWFWWLLEVLLV